MYWYAIRQTLIPLEQEPSSDMPAAVLLTSEELSQQPKLSGLADVLHHTPAARDARVCKAEVRSNCLSGSSAHYKNRRQAGLWVSAHQQASCAGR